MHTYSVFCRPNADLMQRKSVRIAESLQTLCTHCAEQISVIRMPQLGRRGPPAAGAGPNPVHCHAKLWPRDATRRPGEAKQRQATWQPWKAKRGGSRGRRRPGRRSCTPVRARRAPACGDGCAACVRDGDGCAACVRDTLISSGFRHPTPPPSSHDEYRAGRARDREESKRAGGERSAPRRA